jgi:hypothetical protein
MARIQIDDLPNLQDLTEEQLKELFGAGPRKFRPSLETLEDRMVMSNFYGFDIYRMAQGPDGTWGDHNNAPSTPGMLVINAAKTGRDDYVQVKNVSSGGYNWLEVDYAPWHFDHAHPQGYVSTHELQKTFFEDNLVRSIYFFGNPTGRNYFRNDTTDTTWAWGSGFVGPHQGAPANVLIGGFSENHLFGGGGDDLLVARTTQPDGGFPLLASPVWHDEYENDYVFRQHLFAFGDQLAKEHFQNELYAAGGNATLFGSSFNDYLSGGSGNVRIYAGQSGHSSGSADFIFGGSGNDYIDPGPGRKEVWGGTGAVTFVDYRGVDRDADLPYDFDPKKGDTLIPVQTGAGTTPDLGPVLAGPPVLATQQNLNTGDLTGQSVQSNFLVTNSVTRVGAGVAGSLLGGISLAAPSRNVIATGLSGVAGASQVLSNPQVVADPDIIDTGADINAIVKAQLAAARTLPSVPAVGVLDQLGAVGLPSDPMLVDRSSLAVNPGLAELTAGAVDTQSSPTAQVPESAAAQTVAPVSPADLTNVGFALTDDSGAAHQLQIQAQAAQPDGTATFTGLWNGEQGTGTLAYDAAGNVHLTFASQSYSFDGTITGNAGAYHLDGQLTNADGSSVHAAGDQSVVQVAPVAQVSDFTNVAFALTDDNGAAHQLQIQAQAAQPDGTATFTGLWNGEQGTGTLADDAAGNLHLTFASQSYSFDGTITGNAGAYHLDGQLTNADGSTIHAAGDQSVVQVGPVAQVSDFTNVAFALTDDNGAAQQLQIQAQADQPDGTATFTGLWNGEQGTGTLAYDAAGNVHLTFASSSYSFDGTFTGNTGAYHLDGQLTNADGSLVHAAGDQLVAQPTPVTDLTSVSFALTDDNGVSHQLQIQTQTAQPDGSADFTAVWDGQNVAGTLAYDGAGNIQIVFNGDSVQFNGTIAGAVGAYTIDGTIVDSLNGTWQVTGGQTA